MIAKKEDNANSKTVCENRKARHDYFIEETFEAGIKLTGTEVKSLRAGRVNLKDSFARIENGEVMLHQMHISPYEQGNRYNHDPLRTRKLLLHRSQINKLYAEIKRQGLSLIPLRIYFTRGLVKVEIALAKGKKQYDKRDDMAERDAKRDIKRHLRERQKM